MRLEAKGTRLFRSSMEVDAAQLEAVASAISTDTAAETSGLVNWFGVSIDGDEALVEALGMDLSRTMLAGQAYTWTRPLEVGEDVEVEVSVEDIYPRGKNHFAVIRTEIRSGDDIVQTQRTTFIESGNE